MQRRYSHRQPTEAIRRPSEAAIAAANPLFAAGPASPSLVPLETAVRERPPVVPPPLTSADDDPPPPAAPVHKLNGQYRLCAASSTESMFRHRSWADRRTHLRRTINRLPMTKGRLERWDSCGAETVLFWDQAGKRIVVTCMHCHDRFCWPCASARSRQIARNLEHGIARLTTRFLTFTLRSNDKPLSDQIDRLYRCFRTLRADPWWREHVAGSATFLEITLHPDTKLWHPHLHPICTGQFIPQEVLSRKWLGVTGDSPIVHVKAVPKPSVVAAYVCKYASKPMDASVFADDDRLAEIIQSTAGRRLCLTTGGFQKLKLTAKPPPLDVSTMRPLGRLNELADAARFGDKRAQAIIAQANSGCTWQDITPADEHDQFGDDAVPW